MKEKGPVTRSWKIWGENGRRQRQSFNESIKYDYSELLDGIFDDGSHHVIEVENFDKTHTHDYSIIHITRNTAEECEKDLKHQLSHGVFENCRVGKVEEITEPAAENSSDEIPDIKLVLEIKERLELLLGADPGQDEIDDDAVNEFYAEAKNLWEAIENLGY